MLFSLLTLLDIPLLDFTFPSASPEPIPGVEEKAERAVGWVTWLFGVAAVGSFLGAAGLGFFKVFGHGSSEGFKKMALVLVIIAVGTSTGAILSAVAG